jgi:FtsP/CotA-like multicopper oxidase with cupredoxin domain
MLDFTAQNVYKGNAVMMNYYSALDRGKEDFDDGVNLRFPSGTALPWGNRDYDVNLLIADKAWDRQGQLWFNIDNLDGFLGDHVLVNWLYHPYFDVRARRYRFRILNGSVSRYFSLAMVRLRNDAAGEFPGPAGSGISYDRVPFHMIANDGNVMEHSVPFDGSLDLDADGDLQDHNAILPEQGIAERYDIIVDFAANGIQPGDRLYMVNVLEHTEGRVVGAKVPLADILSEVYNPAAQDIDADGLPDQYVGGDPGVGRILEFRVAAYAGQDLSMNPADFEPGGQKMIPLPIDRDAPGVQALLASARHRTFEYDRGGGLASPWSIDTDNQGRHNMDPRRISAAPQLATGPTPAGAAGEAPVEIWKIVGGGGWSHPVHIHFEEGVILTKDGLPPPEYERWARKDMYRVGPGEDTAREMEVALRFRNFAGTYMQHCHNTQHEDHAMLLRYDVEFPGQLQTMVAPIPSWEGVSYADSAAITTFRTGDAIGPQP